MSFQGIKRGGGACIGGVGAGIEAVERLGPDTGRVGDREDFTGERGEKRATIRRGEAVGHGIIGERRGEQHRAVGQFAPQIAPDIWRQHRLVVEQAKQRVEALGTRGDTAVDFANDHRATSAELNLAGTEPIRTEIYERADGTLFSGETSDRQFVEPVLHRDDTAIGREVRKDRVDGAGRVLRLHA